MIMPNESTMEPRLTQGAPPGAHAVRIKDRARRRERRPNVGDTERWVSNLLGGALAVFGFRRGGITGFVAGLVGGAMLQRGLTGHCAAYERLGVTPDDAAPDSHPLSRRLHITAAITIAKPVDEVFTFWRDPRNLDNVLLAIRTVEQNGDGEWKWVCETPSGRTFKFTTRVTDELANQRIAWSTVEGSSLEHEGEVTFAPAPRGLGTEVRLRASYLPAGGLGWIAIKRALPVPREDRLKRALRSIKQYLETGEIATPAPSLTQADTKTRERAMWLSRAHGPDHVDEASKESFPASDAPAWAPGTA